MTAEDNKNTFHSEAAYDIKELTNVEQFIISLLRKDLEDGCLTIKKTMQSFDISIFTKPD